MSFQFALKDHVRCKITGFAGIVSSRTEWMNGCVRYGVQPTTLDKDGKVRDADHFDEQQLELVEATTASGPKPTGGPQADEKTPWG